MFRDLDGTLAERVPMNSVGHAVGYGGSARSGNTWSISTKYSPKKVEYLVDKHKVFPTAEARILGVYSLEIHKVLWLPSD